MRRKTARTLFTITLLVAFVADGVDVLSLYFPNRFIAQDAISVSLCTQESSSDLIQTVKRTPLTFVFKFVDIDSPVVQADFSNGEAFVEIYYHLSEPYRLIETSSLPLSLHQLCLLLI